jgi:hypothetical protein
MDSEKSNGEKIADLIQWFAERMLEEERAKYAPCANSYGDGTIECDCFRCEDKK